MTIVAAAAMLMLGAAAALVLVRIYRGPNNLDRIIATEILLIIVIAGIAMEAVWHHTSTSLPLLMILGLVSCVGGVAVTRFMATGTNDAGGTGGPAAGTGDGAADGREATP